MKATPGTGGVSGLRAAAAGAIIWLTLLLGPWVPSIAHAQVDAAREFREDLFAPDLVLREAEALGLTTVQRDAFAGLVKETKKAFARGQTKLRDATGGLAQSLKTSSVTEQIALDQFATILEAEKELKVAQFLMLVRAKNLLTSEQQEHLRKIVESQPAKMNGKRLAGGVAVDARQELNARMQKVQAEVERWQEEGRDPAPILELIKLFGEQMQAGRISEAKETLQRAAERLDEPKPR